jgi:hypothetical protein
LLSDKRFYPHYKIARLFVYLKYMKSSQGDSNTAEPAVYFLLHSSIFQWDMQWNIPTWPPMPCNYS